MQFYERRFEDAMHVHSLATSDYFRQCSYAGLSAGFMFPGKSRVVVLVVLGGVCAITGVVLVYDIASGVVAVVLQMVKKILMIVVFNNV